MGSLPENEKTPIAGGPRYLWRRRGDSNPRDPKAKRFSRPPHSTTLPPLRKGDVAPEGATEKSGGESGI